MTGSHKYLTLLVMLGNCSHIRLNLPKYVQVTCAVTNDNKEENCAKVPSPGPCEDLFSLKLLRHHQKPCKGWAQVESASLDQTAPEDGM